MSRKHSGQFPKGVSGNPKGRPRKIDQVQEDDIPDQVQEHDFPVGYNVARIDGWHSALTGIGTSSYDKRLSHSFRARNLSYQECVEMWRGDDLAKRAIESLPDGCFRQGYEITISDEGNFEDLKEDVESELHRLKVNQLINKAMCYERAYGGAAILIGTNDHRTLDKPLDPTRVTKIEWLTLLEPCEIYPVSYYSDPTAPKYNEPEYYQLSSSPKGGYGPKGQSSYDPGQSAKIQYIHESRLIIFEGCKVSQHWQPDGTAGHGWGDSVLTYLADILRDFNIAWHSAGIIVTDFSQAVFSIDNLMQLVGRNEEGLRKRMQAVEMSRSTARAVLIDTKESFKRETTNVSGLPDMLEQLSLRLAAAIDMPLSLLFGQSVVTGQDSGSDVRFYYDRIQSYQKTRLEPILKFLIQMIMQGLRKRKLPKKWGIKFNPLWQLTEQQKAEARLAQARVDEIYVKAGVLSAQDVRVARFGGEYSFDTPIDESKDAPGFLPTPPKGVGGLGAGAPGTPGATSHQVTSYVRNNPNVNGTSSGSAKPKVTDGEEIVEDREDPSQNEG